MLEIYCCPLADVDATLLTSYRDLLSDDERERLLLFKREVAAQTFIVSRALLRTVLAEKLHCAPQSLRFERDAHDKPQLVDYPLQFNLSHSDGWIALAVSAEGAVGIDIETSARSNNLLGIAKRFFSQAEFEWLNALSETTRAEKFCELWAIKEACVKWSGLGIGRAIAGVDVAIDGERIALDLRADIAAFGVARALLFALTPSVRLAVVSESVCESVSEQVGFAIHRRVPLGLSAPMPCVLLARS